MKILITGVAGFIGFSLAKKLLDKNEIVYGIDNLDNYYNSSNLKNIRLSMLKKYKKFHLVERDTSHEQLISEGINLVLTGFGTIGFEYAYFNIPVINASINNPHISFDFNAHPSSIKEYKDSIINYKELKINYDKNQLYEYFFMRYVNSFYLYPDELTRDRDMEGFDDHSSLVYKKWLNLFNEEFNKDLKYKLTNFIDSDQYKFKNEIKL